MLRKSRGFLPSFFFFFGCLSSPAPLVLSVGTAERTAPPERRCVLRLSRSLGLHSLITDVTPVSFYSSQDERDSFNRSEHNYFVTMRNVARRRPVKLFLCRRFFQWSVSMFSIVNSSRQTSILQLIFITVMKRSAVVKIKTQAAGCLELL